MERLFLRNNENLVFEAKLIRYFEYDEAHYLIYTLDETDNKGYLKLYLLEVLEELGEIICYNISDDDYWKAMENIVKCVIKEIKSGNRNLLKDLSPLELNNVKVVEPRYFKLDRKLADILSSNYMVTEETKIEIGDNEIEDLVIEPIELPEDEIIEVDNKEDNMNNENNVPNLNEQTVPEQVVEEPVSGFKFDFEPVEGPNLDVNPVLETNVDMPKEVDSPPVSTFKFDFEPIDGPTFVEQVKPTISNFKFDFEPVEGPSSNVNPVLNSSTEVQEPIVSQTVDASDDVNYKELYFAIKEEKEATEKAFEELMEELMKYKEKYGELE